MLYEVITADHIRALRSYDWPGNVRELGNIIERALILFKNERIDFNGLVRNNFV